MEVSGKFLGPDRLTTWEIFLAPVSQENKQAPKINVFCGEGRSLTLAGIKL